MTVGAPGAGEGELLSGTRETALHDGSAEVSFTDRRGVVHADLRVGANVAAARALRANEDLGNRGVQLLAPGFVITQAEAFEA